MVIDGFVLKLNPGVQHCMTVREKVLYRMFKTDYERVMRLNDRSSKDYYHARRNWLTFVNQMNVKYQGW